jgi:hypothetical protein
VAGRAAILVASWPLLLVSTDSQAYDPLLNQRRLVLFIATYVPKIE